MTTKQRAYLKSLADWKELCNTGSDCGCIRSVGSKRADQTQRITELCR